MILHRFATLTRKLGTVCFHGRYLKRTCRSLHAVDGRNPAPVEVSISSHYLRGFIHPRWLAVSRISSINRSLPKIPSHPVCFEPGSFQEMGYLLPAPPNQPSSVGGFRRAGQIPFKSGGNLAKITPEILCHANFFCRHMSLHFTCKLSFGQQICDVLRNFRFSVL